MLDRSIAPVAEAIQKPHFPKYHTHELTSGSTLYSINQGDQPIILMEMAIPIHEDVEPEVTYFLCKMLTEGTKSKSSPEIAEALEYYGSHLEATPSFDHIFIRLFSLKRFFSIQLQLLEEILNDSIFPESEFENVRAVRIQNLLQQQAKTATVASQKFRQGLFGADHFYGKIVLPEVSKAINLGDVKQYYETSFRSIPAVFLTGKVSQDEITLVSDFVDRIQFSSPNTDRKPVSTHSVNVNESWKNAVQSSIRIGGQTIDRNHPDIHTLKIANDLYGGFFGSRLMKNIREEKGLTYGIHSGITHLDGVSYWSVGTDVLKEKAPLAVEEILNELNKLINEPPSRTELDTVINYSKGRFLMSFDSAINSMSMIRGLVLSGRDYSHWESFFTKVNELKPEDISETLKKYLNISSLTQVIVG